MGAHGKYNDNIANEIYALIRSGATDKDCIEIMAISQETFYRWIRENDEFRENITRARTESKVARLEAIRRQGEEDWRAHAWYLERRYPAEFSQKYMILVTPEQMEILKKASLDPTELFTQAVIALSERQQKLLSSGIDDKEES